MIIRYARLTTFTLFPYTTLFRSKGVPHGYCFNFSLLDKEGKVAKVEASPENKVVIEKFPMTCTNHFESEGLKKNNTNNMTDTEKRQRVAKESIRKHLTPLQAYYAFNNEEGQDRKSVV